MRVVSIEASLWSGGESASSRGVVLTCRDNELRTLVLKSTWVS